MDDYLCIAMSMASNSLFSSLSLGYNVESALASLKKSGPRSCLGFQESPYIICTQIPPRPPFVRFTPGKSFSLATLRLRVGSEGRRVGTPLESVFECTLPKSRKNIKLHKRENELKHLTQKWHRMYKLLGLKPKNYIINKTFGIF